MNPHEWPRLIEQIVFSSSSTRMTLLSASIKCSSQLMDAWLLAVIKVSFTHFNCQISLMSLCDVTFPSRESIIDSHIHDESAGKRETMESVTFDDLCIQLFFPLSLPLLLSTHWLVWSMVSWTLSLIVWMRKWTRPHSTMADDWIERRLESGRGGKKVTNQLKCIVCVWMKVESDVYF